MKGRISESNATFTKQIQYSNKNVEWLRSRPDYKSEMEVEYRYARSSEQVRVAEVLHELYSTAGVLLVDAQGHRLMAAKIASTAHDTFHAFMLSDLDHHVP